MRKSALAVSLHDKEDQDSSAARNFSGGGEGGFNHTLRMFVQAFVCMPIYMYARLKKFFGRGLNPAGYASGPSNGGIAISPRAVVTFDSHCSGPVVSCQVKKT